MNAGLVIVLTGVLVAVACALLGSFLILRRMAMLADAISHAILPGLVLGYFVAQGPNLLAGFVGASLAAVITVALVEALQNTRRVGGESAIGLIFPAMFALGTVLISRFFANVHLDTDAVLFGSIEFSSFDLLYIGDLNLGPQSLWVMSALCVINLLFIVLFYKELKVATFDAGLAATLGFSPILIHYALMTVLSITTVGAFTAVGAILVVALIIVPAATAYLLTNRLALMIVYAAGIGALSAVSGYAIALALDASVAGCMATMCGIFFATAHLFSPQHGIVSKIRRRQRQRIQFASDALIIHLHNHERTARQAEESKVTHLISELRWTPVFADQVIGWSTRSALVEQISGHLSLTDQGRAIAQLLARTLA